MDICDWPGSLLSRRASLNKYKREHNIPSFDLGLAIERYRGWAKSQCSANQTPVKLSPLTRTRFRHLLYGHFDGLSHKHTICITISPYSGRQLKHIIHSTSIQTPIHIQCMKQLRARCSSNRIPSTININYVYFKRQYLSQVNQLLILQFWPNIDVTDSLLYPEYGIVAIYKKLVVGCALMTPDGYINYIAVLPGWQGVGMARFMIVWLCHMLPKKDITLHVSANNSAMILYQYLGFKPEQFIIAFYKSYYPIGSLSCHNALFLRLRQCVSSTLR